MRSLIIIEVEHGEDTDALTAAAQEAQSYINGFDYFQDEGLRFVDYTVKVDLPECFVLDKPVPNDGKAYHPFKPSSVSGWEDYCIEPTDEGEECGWAPSDHKP